MKHEIATLSGTLLDAAVAKAEGWLFCPPPFLWEGVPSYWWKPIEGGREAQGQVAPAFSTDWQHGGPIIERERISIGLSLVDDDVWIASVEKPLTASGNSVCVPDYEGPTPLIAAMRAFVASRFGEEVEL